MRSEEVAEARHGRMKMKKLIWIAVLGIALIGCKAKSTPQASPSAPSTATARSASPTPQIAAEDEYHSVVAVYESCTTYTGATDFVFRSEDGKMIQFRYSDLTEEEPAIVLPVPLVDPNPGEGPPGPNPEWVGRRFLLTLNAKDEVVSLEPIPSDESGESNSEDSKKALEAAASVELGESHPENAKKALEAASNQPDLQSVQLNLPAGYTAGEFGSHEGTAVTVQGGPGELHIFLPNPDISVTGESGVLGENGLFESNGWSTIEAGRQTQPAVGWASATYPFTGPEGLEGVVWLGQLAGREVRVTASAPSDQLDEYYSAIGTTIQGMRLR